MIRSSRSSSKLQVRRLGQLPEGTDDMNVPVVYDHNSIGHNIYSYMCVNKNPPQSTTYGKGYSVTVRPVRVVIPQQASFYTGFSIVVEDIRTYKQTVGRLFAPNVVIGVARILMGEAPNIKALKFLHEKKIIIE